MADPTTYSFWPALPLSGQDRLCSIIPINVCNGTLSLSSAGTTASSPQSTSGSPDFAAAAANPPAQPAAKEAKHEPQPHVEHAKKKKH
jgi:hypothetical protein